MRKSMRRLTGPLQFFAAVLTAASVLIPAAHAQAPSPSSPSPGLSVPSPNIPDQKLDAVAAALGQVVGIKEDFQQRLQAADPSDKQRIVDEANTALEKAVTDHGLSVQEYATIMVIAQNDPEVREKILQRLAPAPDK
jgi:hypothetical protein